MKLVVRLLIAAVFGFGICSTSLAAGTTPQLSPFGSELFQGDFSAAVFDELNSDYIITPGDRVAVRLWGARNFEGILDVDSQGNLFLPEVGPVRVGGLPHSQLSNTVKGKVSSVYSSNVDVYTNLINAQPVAVYVTGFVNKPGRYSGGATESIMYYLDVAGGIVPETGSYRNISILRDSKVVGHVDIYAFIREGKLPSIRFKEGDVILVEERGQSMHTMGLVKHEAVFEFAVEDKIVGADLVALVSPLARASHVSLTGSRDGVPYNAYLPLADFSQVQLFDDDRVKFLADKPGDSIMVSASGAITGDSHYPVKKGTRLLDLLDEISVEPELANIKGIHLKRRSVALKQKEAILTALNRLEASAFSATSQSVDEASIRAKEAELISKFVEKAKKIEPDGMVVVSNEGELSDLYLENGDEIVIPLKSDVIMVNGEVRIPQSIVFHNKRRLSGYLDGAGGLSDRADDDNILLVRPNGEVLTAAKSKIAPGDQILVMPRFDSKNMQIFKDTSQILYQIAVAARVVLTPW